jgi:hypothetical protein
VCGTSIRFTTTMSEDTTPQTPGQSENPADLTDEQLVDRLQDHRRGTGEWAAVLGEIQRRSDRQARDARFKAALESADDGLDPNA